MTLPNTTISAREIFFLTVPQLGLMLCHLAVSMTDIWVAGQLDTAIVAVLGFISQISALLMLVISIAGSGCMATVSQAVGAGKHLRARCYAGLILAISFMAGAFASGLALTALPLIISLDVIPPDLQTPSLVFGVAYAAQAPFFYCMVILNSIFRAHKLVWLPFCTLVLVAASNFVISAGFGLGCWAFPDYGYGAVAAGTLLSAIAGFGCNIILAVKKGILARRSFAPWKWNKKAAPRLWRIGAPAALGNLASNLGRLSLLTLLAELPDAQIAEVAGMTLGSRIIGFLVMPMAALGMTVTILSGHFIGAKKFSAARQMGTRCAIWSALAMGILALILWLARKTAVAIFDPSPEAVAASSQFLGIACLTLPFQAIYQILAAVFAGAGETRITCRIDCICMWCFSIPTGIILAYLVKMQAVGIYLGMAFGNVCAVIMVIAVFRKNAWMRQHRSG